MSAEAKPRSVVGRWEADGGCRDRRGEARRATRQPRDDDSWKRDGGAFSVIAPPDADRAEHPVARALVYLRGLHYDARWMAPSEVLTRLVIDRRMLELAAAGPRTGDAWRRLRFVVDQARAWSESEHGGLRAYLAWAHLQGAETSRVVEERSV